MMSNKTRISSLMLFLPLVGLASEPAFAGTWSGALVDAKCFESAQGNHNVSDSPALQDVGFEVRLCSPKAKTRSFEIVQPYGAKLTLDSKGNELASQLVEQGLKKSPWYVTVTGDLKKQAIAVNSITPMK
jgi:hypothetical protein